MRPEGNQIHLKTASEWDDELKAMLPTKVCRIYEGLWSLIWENLENLFAGEEDQFILLHGQELVLAALQANYRIGWREISILEIYTDGIVPRVWDLLIDISGFEQKKSEKAPPTGSISSGEPVLTTE